MLFNEVKEKCGIYAISNTRECAYVTYLALHNLQHRGQEGAGISVLNNNNITTIKNCGLVDGVFKNVNFEKELAGNFAIGHVRYATTGVSSLKNVQPLNFEYQDLKFSLAHNGNLSNDNKLRKYLMLKNVSFTTATDSELIGHLIILYYKKYQDLDLAINKTLNKLEGAFCLSILTNQGLYIVKDKYGFRPLVMAKKNNSYIFCSESCALGVNDGVYIRDVEPGEVIKVDLSGNLQNWHYVDLKLTSNNICAMELIYFARPDSNINQLNVHKARKKLGQSLAKQMNLTKGLVIGVPDSSLSAAQGFSKQLNLPMDMGIIKNRYIARTFINPSEKSRYDNLNKKFSINKSVIKDQDIILVDDSIVRGTTMKVLIDLVKKGQPKSITLAICAPKITNICYYGIDMSDPHDLLANQFSEKQMAEFFDIKEVCFLKLQSLKNIFKDIGICHGCFSGEYLTKKE